MLGILTPVQVGIMVSKMRTTLTIDDDLATELKAEALRTGQSLNEIVNTALRRGLRARQEPGPARAAFRVEPFASEFQLGVDPGRLNQLSDELETEDFLAKREKPEPAR